MRPPSSLPLPAALRRRLLANYAWPPVEPAGHRLAGLAFRLASAELSHASRVCAGVCADRLPPQQPQLRPARVLELGCGAGYALAELRRLRPGLQLFGVDTSSPALELARRRLPTTADDDRTPPVRLYQARAENLLAVGTGSCQAVMHANCYPVWARPPASGLSAICTEAFRVLAPAGRLVSAADCWFAAQLAAGPDPLLDYLAALEAAGFVRVGHRRAACPATGRPVHLVTADVPA